MPQKNARAKEPHFDVALSFSGADRAYVEKVAIHLRRMGIKVFYDKYEKVSLWGKDLYDHLSEVYSRQVRYVVMFVSKSYRNRLWTTHERKSAQARAFQENREYILPARFDDTSVPGLLDTIGYVDLRKTQPKEFATLVREKLGAIERHDFFPPVPDRLFEPLGARSKRDRELVSRVAYHFFEMTELMTPDERLLIASAFRQACPCGLPNDIHLRLDYFARVEGTTERSILAAAARLDCLSIKTRIVRKKEAGHAFPVMEFRFVPLLTGCPPELGTPVVCAIYDCLFDTLCPECANKALARADFAQLSHLTSFDEKTQHKTTRRRKPSSAIK